MSSNVILRAAGPTGSVDEGIVKVQINIYVNDHLAAQYDIDGKNSITYDLYATTNQGIYLKIHDYTFANNLFCIIQKSIYRNDFGMAIISDITNEIGIIPVVSGYVFKMDNLSYYYPIIQFNQDAITKCIINGQSSLSMNKISVAQSESFNVNLTTKLTFNNL